MIIERVTLTAIPGGGLQLGKALASLIGPTGVQTGCRNCRLFQSCQYADEFQVQMDWDSTDDLIRHLRSETYKQFLLLMELSPSQPLVQFYTVDEVRGLELVATARDSLN